MHYGIRPSILHEADTQRGVVQLVQHSNAVGVVDRELFADALPSGPTTVALTPKISSQISMIYDANRTRSFVFDNFINWLDASETP